MDREYWEKEIINALKAQSEHNHLDFKTDLSNDNSRLKEHVNAFGNYTGGGCFVFSVDKFVPRELGGRADVITQKLTHIAKDTQEPPLNVSNFLLTYKGIQLLCLAIGHGSSLPVFIKDRAPFGGEACFKRTGSSTVAMSIQEIRDLLSRSSSSSLDESPVEGAQLSELNLDLIKEFIPSFPKSSSIEAPESIAVLKDANIVVCTNDEPKITTAGWLTFGKNLETHRAFRNAYIEFQIFKTSTREDPIRKQEIRGSLPLQIKTSIDTLMQHVWNVPYIQGARRQDIPAYNEEVLREVITNSLVHRDYTKMHQPVKIALFSDRLEIENPGGLMPGLTILNLIHQRDWRNPLLAQLMKKFGFGEMDGQGIDRIYANTRQLKVPAPLLTDNKTSFKVTLLGPKGYEEFSQEERQRTVLILLITEQQIDNESVRNAFGIDTEKATTLITSMVERGVICQKNKSRKFAKYELTENFREKIFG